MKRLFLALVLGNFLIDILSYLLLPSHVATHFGGSGAPNGWFSAEVSLIFNLVLHGLFFGIIYMSSTALLTIPKELINLPNKNYWLSNANIPAFKIRWETVIFQLGCALMTLFLVISLLIIAANFSDPIRLNNGVFIAAIILFLLFMVYWIFLLYKTFRLPK